MKMKANQIKNEQQSNEKLIRDIELYQKIFLQTKKNYNKESSLQIRRLLPNIQSQHQQSTNQQLFSNSNLQCFNTQLDQETSYSNQLLQEKRRKKITISLMDCSKIFKSPNLNQQLPLHRTQSLQMQKIVVVNHQGRPQTYYMK